MNRSVRFAVAVGILWTSIAHSVFDSKRVEAQETAVAVTPISARFVPDDAIVVAVASPAELLANKAFEMFPIEVLRAQAIDRAGIDPLDVSLLKIVVGMPDVDGPKVGIVVSLKKQVQINKLLEALNADTQTTSVDGLSAYPLGGQPDVVLHQLNETTLMIASTNYLKAICNADNGTGQLPALVSKIPRQSGLTIVAAMQQIRPMVSGVAMQQAQQLPPPLQPLGQVPGLIDALLIHTDLNGMGSNLALTLLCIDDAAAGRVETILNDSIKSGRAMGIAAMKDGMAQSEESDLVKAATEKYANRIADTIIAKLKPTRTGRKIGVSVESTVGIASAGVMVGLLLPAVQAAREASRRMSGGNSMKQVLLAFHNYHAAYNRLPAPAITDDKGNALLSWRVALLPFVEEQELYQKFHLDEPWDSEHNLPLSQQLPAAYADPSADLPPGYTVIHAVVGDNIGLRPIEKTGFRDFLDGTSNSLLIVEVSQEAAVPWSKPEDVEIDLTDPLASMGDSHQGGFHVGMCDGAVKFIANTIDVDLFKALLTRAGRETIQAMP